MYYTIYKTTNKITNEFYIGQHATEELTDGYLGSGTRLINSIDKYGKDNFTKEILFVFDTYKEMNDKEIEIVNEEFLSDPLTLNLILGGSNTWSTGKTVVIEKDGKWERIPCSEYASTYITPTSGTIKVFDKKEGLWKRVCAEEYRSNKEKYDTASSGRVSVFDKKENKTKSILVSEYNDDRYEKVLGGIVAICDNGLRYVSPKEFKEKNLKGCHSGKVTVIDTLTNEKRHVTKEEFKKNRSRYKTLTEGKVIVYDTKDNKYCTVAKEVYRNNPERYKGTTSGQKTVWDMESRKFKNIKIEDFNRNIHRLAGDKYIICTDSNGDVIIEFWGSKIDFVKKYGYTIYNQAIKETQNYQPHQRKKFKKYIGCSFKLKKWY